MADVSVRPARGTDAPELARIQLETWRSGYTSILPAAVLEALSVEEATATWAASLTNPPSARHRVLVAQEAEWTVGFVVLAPEDEPGDQSGVVIGPLLVEPRWGRRGHGSRLLAAAIDTSRLDGVTRAVAWLPEADEASRAFFGSAGWAADGLARVFDTGAGELREIRIHVSLEDG
jgi:L-amino acid N-acyltransferase YncA